MTLDAVESALNPFLTSNPTAKIGKSEDEWLIERPWNDRSLRFKLPPAADEVIAILNEIYLPPVLTAVWHKSTRDLEFIYSVVPANSELIDRRFEFELEETSYQCEFAETSSAVRKLALMAEPVARTETEYRNLPQFRFFFESENRGKARRGDERKPLSFYVRALDWDDDHIVQLVNHLNFYMQFYDLSSPRIVVHTARPETKVTRPNRYLFGPFPAKIAARQLDPFLLGLWSSAMDSDALRAFLHYYQILEYAAFYYLRDETLHRIKKIMAAPHLSAHLADAAKQILESTVDAQQDSGQKMTTVITKLVSPASLWSSIEPNADLFSKPCDFDGGLTIPPLIGKGWTLSDFEVSWGSVYPGAIRDIRNGIVHAREKRNAKVISPTKANYNKLRRWLFPLQTTATEVIIYWGTVLV